MELLDTTASVETPERVRFRHRVAGPGTRAMAWGIDAAIRLFLIVAVLGAVAATLTLTGLPDVGAGATFAFLFLLEWLYGVYFEAAHAGQTPGKRLLSLRVVRLDGAPIHLGDALLRNLMRAADFLPLAYGIGAATMLVDRRLRRLGDLVAGTVVVAEDRAAGPLEVVVLDPPVTEEERRALPSRVDLVREEVAVIEAFLRRRSRLGPERSEELAGLLGPTLSARTGVVAPTWERVLAVAYARATGRDRGEG